MSAAGVLSCVFGQRFFQLPRLVPAISFQVQQQRYVWKPINKPKPGIDGKSYRRIVHFKDKYTVEPLNVTNLAGRDPVTGRIVAKGIGGGIKYKYHWIKWVRDGPTSIDEKPIEERVLAVFEDGCRSAHVALVGCGRELKYILATMNMKPGDIIRTSRAIPRIPVKANEGDAYPLGALPIGTQVHCVEKYPGLGGVLIHGAGTFGTLLRKDGTDRVIIKMPSKKEFSLHETCMATVGRLSNILHGSTPWANIQEKRAAGYRPRSGLWQRKTGRHGRKIKKPPPVREFNIKASDKEEFMCMTLSEHLPG